VDKNSALKELKSIPGVGDEISKDLWGIGIRSVKSLKGKNPDILYKKMCVREGEQIDRCMLYVLRCVVYYASEKKHDKKLLKWWNWKDK